MEVKPETYRIAFSVKLRRPGCVLMQAVHGGTVPSKLFHELFPSETWIVGGEGADDVAVYEATRADLEKLSRMALAAPRGER